MESNPLVISHVLWQSSIIVVELEVSGKASSSPMINYCVFNTPLIENKIIIPQNFMTTTSQHWIRIKKLNYV